MLVTIYKVLYPGLEQIDQYYRWRFEFPAATAEPRPSGTTGRPRQVRGKLQCPGCGRVLTYSQVYGDTHKCPGTLTPEPVVPRRLRQRHTAQELAHYWRNYVEQAGHPVQFADTPD